MTSSNQTAKAGIIISIGSVSPANIQPSLRPQNSTGSYLHVILLPTTTTTQLQRTNTYPLNSSVQKFKAVARSFSTQA